ncbi:phosphate-binding protein PstS 2 precursor [mine drainage metagenome]|uniref:Phosphate-binding protein PstS 2 n=1 Tax=mine drainage metagenome TaxID=410659 RepID=A0A1J5QF10_9ZZZZ
MITGNRTNFAIGASALAATMLLLSGCGSSTSSTKAITISGAGSTAVKNLLDVCIPDYRKATGTTVNYSGGGSGAGRAAFTAGTVDFAFSDAPYGAAETKPSNFVYVPNVAFPVAVMVKLAGYTQNLNLSAKTISKIYAGAITRWNDPAIVADNASNAGAKLPATPITVWYRADKSGTTGVFTNWLTQNDPATWTKPGSAGQQTFSSAFPGSSIPAGTFQSASGSDGVANGVASKDGSIGYAETAYASARSLIVARVQNGAGAYLAPTSAATAAFLNNFTPGAQGTIKVDPLSKVPDAYTLASYSYGLAYGSGKDAAKQAAVKSFFTYVLTTCANNHATEKGYIPVVGGLGDLAKTQIATIG